MSLATRIQSDISKIAFAMGSPIVTWQAEDYPCVVGSAADALALGVGGFEKVADLILIITRDLFSDGILPREQQTLTYQGKSYRIAKVVLDALGAFVKLACVATSKGV